MRKGDVAMLKSYFVSGLLVAASGLVVGGCFGAADLQSEEMGQSEQAMRYCPPGSDDDCIPRGPIERGVVYATHPHFKVITIAYDAPGDRSTVTYGTGSTAGTEDSATSTFDQTHTISASSSTPIWSWGASAGLTVSNSSTTTLETTKAKDVTWFAKSNANKNEIDHSEDTFYIWVNPQVDVTVWSKTATWTLRPDQSGTVRVIRT